MKINKKTLKIEIDLKETLEPSFESKLQDVGNNLGKAITNIFANLKSFKEEFEESEEYKKAFEEFCKNKLNND